MKKASCLTSLLLLFTPTFSQTNEAPFLVVLGIAQDAGFPQAGCERVCCASAWRNAEQRRNVTALAIVDPRTSERWLVEATPHLPEQLRALNEIAPPSAATFPSGIFLTHAHIGHYSGLMHLGREVIGAKAIPVYAMPRMSAFLNTNGPWEQLVRLQNITLRPLRNDSTITLNPRLRLTPLLVPHRDEYSETVGFRITGPGRSVLFIPDIDKWEKWTLRIEAEIAKVEVAYLDGTFYAEGEIPGRNMAEIPHPFIVESVARWQGLAPEEKSKIRFIHFNHTNPVLREQSAARQAVYTSGFQIAREGERINL